MEAKIGHYFKRLTMIENTFGDTDYHLRRVTDARRVGVEASYASQANAPGSVMAAASIPAIHVLAEQVSRGCPGQARA